MSTLPNYKEMRFYQAALELAYLTHEEIKTFPEHERFGLVDQMNRSSLSVVSNIAEGSGRDTVRQLFQFLSTANGSLCELDTQYDLARLKGYLELTTFKKAKELITETSKTMWGYRKWLETKGTKHP